MTDSSFDASKFHAERTKLNRVVCVGQKTDALWGANVLSEVDVTSAATDFTKLRAM
jgi:hypothetical protein